MSDEPVSCYLIHEDPLNEIINDKNALIQELKEYIRQLTYKHKEECEELHKEIERLSSTVNSLQTKKEIISTGNIGEICSYYERVIEDIQAELSKELHSYKGFSILLNVSQNNEDWNNNANLFKQISNMKKVISELEKENSKLKDKLSGVSKFNRTNEVQKIFIRKFEVELEKNNKILQEITANYNSDVAYLNKEINNLKQKLNEEREKNKKLRSKNDLANRELTIEHLSDTLSATVITETATKTIEEEENTNQNIENFKFINSNNVLIKDKLSKIKSSIEEINKKNENKTHSVIINRLASNSIEAINLIESEIHSLLKRAKYAYNAVTIGKNVIKEIVIQIKKTKSSPSTYAELKHFADLGIKYLRIYNNL